MSVWVLGIPTHVFRYLGVQNFWRTLKLCY